MNYGESKVKEKVEDLNSSRGRLRARIQINAISIVILLAVGLLVTAAYGAVGVIQGLFDSLPELEELDFIPKGAASILYDAEGRELQQLSDAGVERRYVTEEQIPDSVRNAFVAEADQHFYEHQEIDIKGIIKDIYEACFGSGQDSRQAVTITRQLLENQIFGGERKDSVLARLSRTVQERYLAVRLEEDLGKEQILEYYLNTINLGNDLLGVQEASSYYFDRDVQELTISEAAVLAGILQDPAEYDPITNQEQNQKKRQSILKKMLDQQFITEEEYEDALGDDVYGRILLAQENAYPKEDNNDSCYAGAVAQQALEDLKKELGYTQTQAYNAIYRNGLKIYTCQESALQKICDQVLNDDSYYPEDIQYYLSYRLKVKNSEGGVTEYDETDIQSFFQGRNENIRLYFDSQAEAKKRVAQFKKAMAAKGTQIAYERMRLVKQPQASFVLIEQSTGQVKAIVGGRGEGLGYIQNRATLSAEQPGSALTPLAVYLPALDTAGMTLGTVWNDRDNGLTTLREGIVHTLPDMNKAMLEQISPQTGFDYLRNLGITTVVEKMETKEGQVDTDIRLETANGKLMTGVTNLELTSAYACLANKGVYREPVFYTRIEDAEGNVLIDRKSAFRQVVKKSAAWLMTDAMEEAASENTETLFDEIEVQQAGIEGNSQEGEDLWFEGYTPYYTAGIWFGHDDTEQKVAGDYCQIMWREIMEQIHLKKGYQKGNFEQPDGLNFYDVCDKCGKLAVKGLCDEALGGNCIRREYYVAGTEPRDNCDCHVRYVLCRDSGELASEKCPDTVSKVYLVKKEATAGADRSYMLPEKLADSICSLHGREVEILIENGKSAQATTGPSESLLPPASR